MADKMTLEDRIAHFIKLSEDGGATQHERDLAAEQAERLMIKHAIDRTMLNLTDTGRPEEAIVVKDLFFSGTYAYEEMTGLCAVIRSLGLYPYYTDYRRFGMYDRETFKTVKGMQLHIAGFESDVDDALRLIASLRIQTAVALKDWAKTGLTSYMSGMEKYKARRNFIEYFGRGAGARIKETLKQETQTVTGSELVLVDRSKKVSDYVNSTVKLGRGHDRRQYSSGGVDAGYSAGKNANFGGKAVSGGSRAINR